MVFFFLGENSFFPMNYHFIFICFYELLILYYTLMNYYFVTNDPLPLVKDVKRDGQRVTCVNNTVNGVVNWRNNVVNNTINRLI